MGKGPGGGNLQLRKEGREGQTHKAAQLSLRQKAQLKEEGGHWAKSAVWIQGQEPGSHGFSSQVGRMLISKRRGSFGVTGSGPLIRGRTPSPEEEA